MMFPEPTEILLFLVGLVQGIVTGFVAGFFFGYLCDKNLEESKCQKS
jgi:uncharacterized protein involved in cysteine biosynthesis